MNLNGLNWYYTVFFSFYLLKEYLCVRGLGRVEDKPKPNRNLKYINLKNGPTQLSIQAQIIKLELNSGYTCCVGVSKFGCNSKCM